MVCVGTYSAEEISQKDYCGETRTIPIRPRLMRCLTATSGRPMTAPTLREILLNPRVRGLSTFNPTDPDTGYRLVKDRKIVGKGTWSAIVDEATGEKLDAVLRDPSRRRSHSGNSARFFLASVLTCTCGAPLYAHHRKNKRGERQRFYSCKCPEPGGSHDSIGAEVDVLVEAVILKRMAQPYAVEALQQAKRSHPKTMGLPSSCKIWQASGTCC